MNLVTQEEYTTQVIAYATAGATICRQSYQRNGIAWDAKNPYRYLSQFDIDCRKYIDQQLLDYVNTHQVINEQ